MAVYDWRKMELLVEYRFYDRISKKLLYPTVLNDDIYYNVDEKNVSIGYCFLHPERFEASQLIYLDGNTKIYEFDYIRYVNPDTDEDEEFESVVRSNGEVELPDGYCDFDITSIKWLDEMGLRFYVAGNVYEVEE